ncbi:MAG: hypothetical protein AAGK04_02335 [Planctomycetota bacterium]
MRPALAPSFAPARSPQHRRSIARLAFGTLSAALAFVVLVAMAPEPDPTPSRWELDLELGPMRIATVDTTSGPRAFWYLTLKVENNSGRDQFFVPAFDLATDRGQVVRAGRGVPGSVYAELLNRLQNPLLETQFAVQDLLLQGEENAKEALVVWPAVDLDADRLSVFFIGFSGENKRMFIPDPETKELVEFVTRKTYMVQYCTPGQIRVDRAEPFEVCGRVWVMR